MECHAYMGFYVGYMGSYVVNGVNRGIMGYMGSYGIGGHLCGVYWVLCGKWG